MVFQRVYSCVLGKNGGVPIRHLRSRRRLSCGKRGHGGVGGTVQISERVVGKEAVACGAADAVALGAQRVDLAAEGADVQQVLQALGKSLALIFAGLLGLTGIGKIF